MYITQAVEKGFSKEELQKIASKMYLEAVQYDEKVGLDDLKNAKDGKYDEYEVKDNLTTFKQLSEDINKPALQQGSQDTSKKQDQSTSTTNNKDKQIGKANNSQNDLKFLDRLSQLLQ
jgi:hypothetical protein